MLSVLLNAEVFNIISTEPQINRYFTAKRREASRLYNSRFRRDAMLRVSNYK
ncbi:MAG: hypothetical protein VSS75_019575 [Candidatus Parabeggiatoa sp.]